MKIFFFIENVFNQELNEMLSISNNFEDQFKVENVNYRHLFYVVVRYRVTYTMVLNRERMFIWKAYGVQINIVSEQKHSYRGVSFIVHTSISLTWSYVRAGMSALLKEIILLNESHTAVLHCLHCEGTYGAVIQVDQHLFLIQHYTHFNLGL